MQNKRMLLTIFLLFYSAALFATAKLEFASSSYNASRDSFLYIPIRYIDESADAPDGPDDPPILIGATWHYIQFDIDANSAWLEIQQPNRTREKDYSVHFDPVTRRVIVQGEFWRLGATADPKNNEILVLPIKVKSHVPSGTSLAVSIRNIYFTTIYGGGGSGAIEDNTSTLRLSKPLKGTPIPSITVSLSMPDSDGDGVEDDRDACPNDSTEWRDLDSDGICDGKDEDADGDGLSNAYEIANRLNEYNASDATGDYDSDGLDNLTEYNQNTLASKGDSDDDGVNDKEDVYPLDGALSARMLVTSFAKTVDEAQAFEPFVLVSSDMVANTTIEVTGPSGMTYSQGNLTYYPDYEAAGTYEVTIHAKQGIHFHKYVFNLVVENVNRPPVAQSHDLAASTRPVQDYLKAFAYDPDGDTLQYEIVDAPQSGKVTIDTDGLLEYTANSFKENGDTLTFRVRDYQDYSSLATITVSIPDSDGDGMKDMFENAYGLDPTTEADRNSDLDGDGLTNYNEWLVETDPTQDKEKIDEILQFGGLSHETAKDIAIDSNGFTYLLMSSSSEIDLDPTNGDDIRSTNSTYLTKLYPNGDYAWTKELPPAQRVVIDAQDNVLIGGRFDGTLDFDPSSAVDEQTATGGKSVFVTKIYASGGYAWTRVFGDSTEAEFGGISTDSEGSVFLSGAYLGTQVDFDFTQAGVDLHPNRGWRDGFVTKLDAQGNYGWTYTMGGISNDSIYAAKVHQASGESEPYVYISGYYRKDVDFDPDPDVTESYYANHSYYSTYGGVFITKLSLATGEYQWTRVAPPVDHGYYTGNGTGKNIFVTNSGEIALLGQYGGHFDFDGPDGMLYPIGDLPGGSWSIFLIRYNTSGEFIDVTFPSTGDDRFLKDAVMDSDGNFYIAGTFKGAINFDNNGQTETRTAVGDTEDSFLIKLDTDATFASAYTFGTEAYEEAIYGVAAGLHGNVSAIGEFANTTVFDSENNRSLTSMGYNDVFVMRLTTDRGADYDKDGLTNLDEVNTAHAQLDNPDVDNDGITDGYEVWNGLDLTADDQDPTRDDDGDGLSNWYEIQTGSNPNSLDTDGDGMSDAEEYALGMSLTDDGDGRVDADHDGLSFAEEYHLGTLTDNPDTDDDKLPDGYEAQYLSFMDPVGTDDSNGDWDDDGLNNLAEYTAHTYPDVWDTDGDTVRDGDDLFPLDPERSSDEFLTYKNTQAIPITYSPRVLLDSSGNTVLVGSFKGKIDVDPGDAVVEYNSYNNAYDIYVSKYDQTGALLTSKYHGFAINDDYVKDAVIDTSDNVIVAATYDSYCCYGSKNYAAVHKFDENGGLVWSTIWNKDYYTRSQTDAVAVDKGGNIFAIGAFTGTLTFSPEYVLTATQRTTFVAKLSPDGVVQWAYKLGESPSRTATDIVVDAAGYLYVTGAFGGDFGLPIEPGFDSNSSSNKAAYLVKLDANGNVVWTRTFGSDTASNLGAIYEYVGQLTIDNTEKLYIAGQYSSTIDFDPSAGVHERTLSSGNYISQFDLDGNWNWTRDMRALTSNYFGIGFDRDNNMYVYGTGSRYTSLLVDYNMTTEGTDQRNSLGDFVSRYDANGNYQGTWKPNNVSMASGSATVSDSGQVAMVGMFSGTVNAAPDGYIEDTILADSSYATYNVYFSTYQGDVSPENQAPVVADSAVTTVEDQPRIGVLTATDAEQDPLTFVITKNPDHGTLVVDTLSGDYTYTPAQDYNGADSFQYAASDALHSSATATVTIYVDPANDLPVVTALGTQTFNEGSNPTITVEATDIEDDTLVYSAIDLPDGLSIDSNTGAIGGTLSYNSAGSHTTTVSVSDGTGTTSVAFEWIVNNINRAPTINILGNQAHAEGASVNVPFAASDADGEALGYSTTGLPAGLYIDVAASAIKGTLSYSSAGSYGVTLTASDGTDSASTTFTWTVSNTNQAPHITNPGIQHHAEGVGISLPISANDPDGETVNYSATNLPTGLTIDTVTGVITGTLGYSSEGSYTVTVTASDGVDIASTLFIWTVSNTNQVPTIANPGNQNSAEGANINLAIDASDADGEGLIYNAIGLPEGASIDTATGVIDGTLSYASDGNYNVIVTVNDGIDSVSTSFQWTVSNTNRAPTVAAIADQASDEGDTVNLAVSASDADGDALTFTASGLPSGLSIDSTTGVISGLLGAGGSGTYNVNVTVSDAIDTAIASFSWQVVFTNTNPVANIDSASAPLGGSIVLDVLSNDTDVDASDTLTVTSFTQALKGVVSQVADGRLMYRSQSGAPGEIDTFRYTVDDGNGGSATADVTVTIEEPGMRYFIVNPSNATGDLYVVSLADGNTINAGSTQLVLNANEQGTIAAANLSVGMEIVGTQPFSIGSMVDAADMPVPAAFAGTQFVIPHYRNDHTYFVLSPYGDANLQVNYGTGVYGEIAYQGQVLEIAAGSDNTVSGVITSDLPIVVSHAGNNKAADAFAVPPAAMDLWGVRSQFAHVGVLEDGTTINIYASNGGLLENKVLNAGALFTVNNGSSAKQGQGSAIHVIADKPIAAIQSGDSDGGEASVFMSTTYAGRKYGIPVTTQYAVVVCTAADTTVTLTPPGGIAGTQSCSAIGNQPGKLYLDSSSSGAFIPAGSIIESNQPIYVMYEVGATGDETNLLGGISETLVTLTLVPVPDLRNQTVTDASALLTQAGLVLGTQSVEYSDTVAAGLIISHTPADGSQVITGSVVDVVVSDGVQPAVVPDLRSQTVTDASALLTQAGLLLGTQIHAYSDTVVAGLIISHTPVDGSQVAPGSVVDVVISDGVQPVLVPDLRNQNVTDASAILTLAGLVLGTPTHAYSDTVPAGLIISHTPVDGSQVAPGSVVDVVISDGVQPVLVPDLRNQNVTDANALLTLAGLVLGTPTHAYSDTVAAGLIISHTPVDGSQVAPGSVVDVLVSDGPIPVVNNDPVATDDEAFTLKNPATPLVITLLSNDSDVDVGDQLSLSSVDTASLNGGVVTDLGDNTIGYTPAMDFVGVDNFTYTVTDGNGGYGTATVFVTVGNVMPRVSTGMQALYTFQEGTGNVLNDVSGVDTPLNLNISGDVAWTTTGLEFNTNSQTASDGLASSTDVASKLTSAISTTQAMTVEAWVTPANNTQSGPASMVALSQDSLNRNMTLGQSASDINMRVRNSATDFNGSPEIVASANIAGSSLTHVVYTHDVNGNYAVYVNGMAVTSGTSGYIESWDSASQFALGNELAGDKPWSGEIHLVAVFDRALSAAEVDQNYQAGPSGNGIPPVVVADDVTVEVNASRTIDVLANDTGSELSIANFTPASLGTVTLNVDNTFSYQAGGVAGSDSFEYTVTDANGNYASAVVTITVNESSVTRTLIEGDGYNNTIDQSTSTSAVELYGYGGHDALTGSIYDDIFVGGTGQDTMLGGAGNDEFRISGSSDGFDKIDGGDGFDRLTGSSGDDSIGLSHHSGAYVVEQIDGGAGINIIIGDGYSNILDFSNTDMINIASIEGKGGHDTITGGIGNDVIVGGTGNDTMSGGTGDDKFRISGSSDGYDKINGGDGFDRITGSSGDDVIGLQNHSGANVVEQIDGGEGVNIISGDGYSNILDFSSTELIGIDRIEGNGGHDTIIGGIGIDVIVGGTGSDTMSGGAGNDEFVISGDGGFDKITGGDGFDRISGSSGDDVIGFSRYSGLDAVEQIDGGPGFNIIRGHTYDTPLDFSATELINIDRIEGNSGNDNITGSAGDDVIVGGTGGDTMSGGAGDDEFMISGTGDGYDRISGGDGFDRITGSSSDDVIGFSRFSDVDSVEQIDGGEGFNIIRGHTYDTPLDFSATELINVDRIEGNSGHDTIIGSAGNDVIVGGTGGDSLTGGPGIDTAVFNGNQADYEITNYGNYYKVKDINTADGDEGTDTLYSMEYIQFNDGVLGL